MAFVSVVVEVQYDIFIVVTLIRFTFAPFWKYFIRSFYAFKPTLPCYSAQREVLLLCLSVFLFI